MMNLKKLTCIVLATGALALGMSPARAAAMVLYLDDFAGNFVLLNDNDPGDTNLALGAISYTGSLGFWDVTTQFGTDSSTPGQAVLGLSSINASSDNPDGSATLYIQLTNSGMTVLPIYASASASGATTISGATAGNVDFYTYFNGGPVGSASFGTGAFGPSTTPFTGVDTTSAFELGNIAFIEHLGAGSTNFEMTTTVPVPEPVSLGLLGLGLLGLGFARRRIAV